MDFQRIAPLIAVDRMQASTATIVGGGGGANLARNLIRSGLGRIKLVDFDTVELVNICRQEHAHDCIGMLKVDALTAELKRINPRVDVQCYPRDFCSFTEDEIDRHFSDTDVFVFCVDNLPANARGNEVALRLRKPAVWSGVYLRGSGGEVIFWSPEVRSCFRCLCAARYRAWERNNGRRLAAESADVLSVQFVDSIAGMIVLGLLCRGADNFYGRLIGQLADRNFIHVKTHDWTWNGRDIIREQLQIPDGCDAFFTWNAAARRDPDHGEPPCPDCVRFLGRVPQSTPEPSPHTV